MAFIAQDLVWADPDLSIPKQNSATLAIWSKMSDPVYYLEHQFMKLWACGINIRDRIEPLPIKLPRLNQYGILQYHEKYTEGTNVIVPIDTFNAGDNIKETPVKRYEAVINPQCGVRMREFAVSEHTDLKHKVSDIENRINTSENGSSGGHHPEQRGGLNTSHNTIETVDSESLQHLSATAIAEKLVSLLKTDSIYHQDLLAFAAHIDRIGVKPGQHFLDVGAGVNAVAGIILALYGCRIDVVDPAEDRIEFYKERLEEMCRKYCGEDELLLEQVLGRVNYVPAHLRNYIAYGKPDRYDGVVAINVFDQLIVEKVWEDIELLWTAVADRCVMIISMAGDKMPDLRQSGERAGLCFNIERTKENYRYLCGYNHGPNYTVFVTKNRPERRAFTLLEVVAAIAALGCIFTGVISAWTGIMFAGSPEEYLRMYLYYASGVMGQVLPLTFGVPVLMAATTQYVNIDSLWKPVVLRYRLFLKLIHNMFFAEDIGEPDDPDAIISRTFVIDGKTKSRVEAVIQKDPDFAYRYILVVNRREIGYFEYDHINMPLEQGRKTLFINDLFVDTKHQYTERKAGRPGLEDAGYRLLQAAVILSKKYPITNGAVWLDSIDLDSKAQGFYKTMENIGLKKTVSGQTVSWYLEAKDADRFIAGIEDRMNEKSIRITNSENTGIGVLSSGILPHRGKGNLNTAIVQSLGKNLEAVKKAAVEENGALSEQEEEQFNKFETWFSDKKNHGKDVPPENWLPISKIAAESVKVKHGKGYITLWIVELPVKVLGTVADEEFTAHLGFNASNDSEGIIWVASGTPKKPRNSTDIELDIMHETEEYRIALSRLAEKKPI